MARMPSISAATAASSETSQMTERPIGAGSRSATTTSQPSRVQSRGDGGADATCAAGDQRDRHQCSITCRCAASRSGICSGSPRPQPHSVATPNDGTTRTRPRCGPDRRRRHRGGSDQDTASCRRANADPATARNKRRPSDPAAPADAGSPAAVSSRSIRPLAISTRIAVSFGMTRCASRGEP